MYECRVSDRMGRGNSTQQKRRDFLKTATAGSAVAFAGLSGCVGGIGDDDEAADGEDVEFDEVTLGVLEPFTGDFADLAEERNQGEELAIQQVNESDEYDFEFDVAEYDTQLNAEDGVQAANQAIESDGAQFLTGAISSSVALAINEVAEDNEVIYTPGAADVSITGSNCNEYVFRFETSTAQVAEVMTQWLDDQGWDQLHYQIADYAYGDSVLNEIDTRMANLSDGYQQVGTTRSDQGAQDFDAAITQIQDNADAADALIVGATGGHLVRFLVQAAERGLKEDLPIVTTTGSFFVVRAGAGEAAYDVYSGTRYTPDLDTGTNPQFVEDYQDEYGELPDNFSRVGYGSVLMIANGIQEAASNDPDDVKEVLPGMTHETIFGDVAFRECDQQASNPVWMGQNVAPDEGEIADVDLLMDLDGEEAQPDCEDTGCEL